MLFKEFLKGKRVSKRLLTLLTIMAIMVAPFSGLYSQNGMFVQAAQSTEYGLANNIKDGTILHAWCWSFNTIKNNMQLIAQSGYTTIQTSPANACVVGNGGNLKFTNQWWYHYQPTDYVIGNYQLGTEAEFSAMCAEAERYGIKVIVDVVANHVTSDKSKVSSNITSNSNFFHTNTSITDWNSRYQVTQLALLGLWDNNTQNTSVQNYIKNYLLRCVQLGADGFRYDAAKHIELPDDSGFGGNFWPNVLSNGSEFQYGEVLQDSISRDAAYANYMSVTASNYGKKLRDSIGSNSFNASTLINYDIGVSADKIVTWVESHDNYANDISDYGSSEWMNDEQIKLSWAVIAARSGGTPLFFSRPVGGGGQTWDNRFPELTKMGDRGSNLFFDDEVAAVNKFRNAMVGENEYLRNPNGNTKVLMIERGTKGVVIINLNSSDFSLSSATNLANGSYTNQTDNHNQFTVSNGNVTGTLPARSVVVLYKNAPTPKVSADGVVAKFTDSISLTLKSENVDNATYSLTSSNASNNVSGSYTNGQTLTFGASDAFGTTYTLLLTGILNGVSVSTTYNFTKAEATGTTIYFEKPDSWGTNINAYVYDESGSTVKKLAAWPGVAMTLENGKYVLNFDADYTTPLVIFNDGTKQTPSSQLSGYAVVNNATYNINGRVINPVDPVDPVDPTEPVEPSTGTQMVIYYKTTNSSEYIHYRIGNGTWTTAPGVQMSNSEVSGYKVATIEMGTETTLTACFNNGSGSWDNNNSSNYTFTTPGIYKVVNGVISQGAPSASTTNEITVYYYTGWSNSYIHYQPTNGSWTAAPGVQMSSSSVSGYKVITINLGSASGLTACFNNGSGTWDSNNGSNYQLNSAGTYTIKNGVISSGTPK